MRRQIAAVGLALAATLAPAPIATAHADAPAYSCVDDGPRICLPGNPDGQPAACYDDGGVIAALWPCWVGIDPQTGDTDVYTPGDALAGHPSYVY